MSFRLWYVSIISGRQSIAVNVAFSVFVDVVVLRKRNGIGHALLGSLITSFVLPERPPKSSFLFQQCPLRPPRWMDIASNCTAWGIVKKTLLSADEAPTILSLCKSRTPLESPDGMACVRRVLSYTKHSVVEVALPPLSFGNSSPYNSFRI